MSEKIIQRYCLDLAKDQYVRAGDFVTLKPHACMTHDNSWPTALKFMSIGAKKIHDPSQIVFALDHDVQNKSDSNLKKYAQIEAFAKAQGVEFYPAGRGIGHQIMCEEGIAWPGTVTVASDSHANMYGGLGCFGTAIVRSDAASVWATGNSWWQVPRMAKIEFTGSLPAGVTGKDVIIALSGLFNEDEVLNHAIEFTGSEETLRSLSIDSRLTISNMTTEWGALSGLFPIDGVLEGWLRGRATVAAMYQSTEPAGSLTSQRFSHTRIDDVFANPISADKGANYDKHLFLNLSTLSPYISGPNSIKIATPLEQLAAQNIKINKSYLVSCTNSRASDLAAAARVFREASPAKIPDSVKFYIAAASMPEQRVAEEAGDWQVMLDAGAVALPAGCGPCIGLGTGLLEPGEVGISASNRNFKGRMGSPAAKAYLASPEVVAASALSGTIVGPGWYQQPEGGCGVVMGEGDGVKEEERMITAEEALEKIIGQLDNVIEGAEEEEDIASEAKTKKDIEILPGFPSKVSGTILFLDAENVSTDAIYPGKFTYKDDMTTEDMAEVCFQNYDPAFRDIAQEGDVLVSGYNFGCGSSREQAATSILAKKIPLVVAGSFGAIFGRNSINNALMTLEVPKLVQRLRETFSSTETGSQQNSILEPSENRESLDSPPPAPQSSPKKEKKLTRRTDWKLTWDIRRSTVTVKEGENGPTWSQNVAALPPNVQDIIASGGLEKWVKKQIGTS
ncbi:MAG: mitochondrial Homoaconitase [Alectoria sarmentosa]|nr:MAG: mitochondrial Homoaconitase [Alectoria sarmentosa]